jgi:predicted polyphosphate/ATP-dependent NAD kinase
VHTVGGTVGIVANPMSGRDIRRLVAQASVFPNAEKASMVLRIVAACAALGVRRVLVSTDAFGLAAAVLRGAQRQRIGVMPEFCEPRPATGQAADTTSLVWRMRELGAAVIVLLGGDGTVRAAVPALGDTPVLALSTGTNNAFPHVWEATVAGAAAALIATNAVPAAAATTQAKVLTVACGGRRELALVDVCVSTVSHVGARAVWQTASLRELYCTFAEPHAIGLSSIAAHLLPTARDHVNGVAVRLDPAANRRVLAPIAPGVLADVGVALVRPLPPGEPMVSTVTRGTVAVDGEREIEFGPRQRVTVSLSGDGPRVVDVPAVLRIAAEKQLLVTE